MSSGKPVLDGTVVTTSPIVAVHGEALETKNTLYLLGEPLEVPSEAPADCCGGNCS
jgi:hypothetical protein